MAKYADFAEEFLAALYVESEKSGSDYQKAGLLIEKYEIEYKSNWISQIADEWENWYFKDISKVLGGGYEAWSFRIGGQGVRYLEDKFGDLDTSDKLPKPSALKPEEGGQVRAVPDEFPLPQIFIDSTDWTGLAARVDATTLSSIRVRVSELKSAIQQADLDDTTRANALARADAVVCLLEAPDPPFRTIVELLNNPVFTAVLNIAAIFQLLFG